jgi:glyoxylase-like metal-dependent hydrolase (beta-lactamase superfamily II)
MTPPLIHRFATGPEAALVNAYLVETASGVVAIDGTLTVSSGRALRARVEELGKPQLAVLITHAHPDHYGGIVELVAGDDVPVIATTGVAAVIERDDAVKEAILRPMFGEEWPHARVFANQTVANGETLIFDGVEFTVRDLGPSESPHDSIWLLGPDRRHVFLGDQIYDRVHCYLADGFYDEWLANIARLRAELPGDATLHVGHGDAVTPAAFDWQEGYIRTFLAAVRSADWSDAEVATASVVSAMTAYLPGGDNQFLMQLSVAPVADKLGLLRPQTHDAG